MCLYGIFNGSKRDSTTNEYREYLTHCAETIAHIQPEQPIIILCGGHINGSAISEAESVEDFFEQALLEAGASDTTIYLETQSQNSPENVAYAYASINEIGFHVKRATILCDTFRALKLWLIALRIMKGIRVIVIGVERIDLDPHSKRWVQALVGIWYFINPRALMRAIR